MAYGYDMVGVEVGSGVGASVGLIVAPGEVGLRMKKVVNSEEYHRQMYANLTVGRDEGLEVGLEVGIEVGAGVPSASIT